MKVPYSRAVENFVDLVLSVSESFLMQII